MAASTASCPSIGSPDAASLPSREEGIVSRELRREPVQLASRGQRLQRSGLGEATWLRSARGEVGPDQRVAELSRRAGRAPVDPSPEDQPAADAGADGEHDQVLHEYPAGVVEGLVERRHGGVVVDEDRQAEPLLEHSAEGRGPRGGD